MKNDKKSPRVERYQCAFPPIALEAGKPGIFRTTMQPNVTIRPEKLIVDPKLVDVLHQHVFYRQIIAGNYTLLVSDFGFLEQWIEGVREWKKLRTCKNVLDVSFTDRIDLTGAPTLTPAMQMSIEIEYDGKLAEPVDVTFGIFGPAVIP